MGRRSKRAERCATCRMHAELCICAELRPFETTTRLVVVMHRREEKKSTNTGRLSLLSLTNSALLLRGNEGEPLDLSELRSAGRRVLLLFPREDAVPLTRAVVEADPRPVTLVVPDGTWSQTRRVVRREPVLADAEAVIPDDDAETRYLLRNEPTEGGLATAEAIARAFGVLEGPEARTELERVFDLMVSRTLATRTVAPRVLRTPPPSTT